MNGNTPYLSFCTRNIWIAYKCSSRGLRHGIDIIVILTMDDWCHAYNQALQCPQQALTLHGIHFHGIPVELLSHITLSTKYFFQNVWVSSTNGTLERCSITVLSTSTCMLGPCRTQLPVLVPYVYLYCKHYLYWTVGQAGISVQVYQGLKSK